VEDEKLAFLDRQRRLNRYSELTDFFDIRNNRDVDRVVGLKRIKLTIAHIYFPRYPEIEFLDEKGPVDRKNDHVNHIGLDEITDAFRILQVAQKANGYRLVFGARDPRAKILNPLLRRTIEKARSNEHQIELLLGEHFDDGIRSTRIDKLMVRRGIEGGGTRRRGCGVGSNGNRVSVAKLKDLLHGPHFFCIDVGNEDLSHINSPFLSSAADLWASGNLRAY